MSAMDSLAKLSVGRGDDAAIAFAPDDVPPDQAKQLAQEIARHLGESGLPRGQRVCWIIAAEASDDESRTAKLASAIADAVTGSLLIIHDPRDLDALIFQRRIAGQRRGGVYLNAAWQSASVRIACGEPMSVLFGLCAWFNQPARLRPEDLNANIVLGRPGD